MTRWTLWLLLCGCAPLRPDADDDDAGDDDAGDDDSLQLPGDDDAGDEDAGGCCRASAARGQLGVEAGALTLVALRRRRRR